MTRRAFLLASLATAALARIGLSAIAPGSAQAQTPPRRIRGKIVSLTGQTMVVQTREGPNVTVMLADNVAVSETVPLKLDAIKPNSFVGIASLKIGGQDTAMEVVVFPEAARGSGEGSYPWDLKPESSMTNATVGTIATTPTGPSLSLTYKGGEKTIVVPPDVPIVTFVPADRSLLVPGAPVFFGAAAAADGSLSTARIVTGRNGNAPPM